jgi:hypothetical protein
MHSADFEEEPMSYLNDRTNAIDLLRTEHQQMRDLLTVVARTENLEQRLTALNQLSNAVCMHTELEQRLFCPSVVRHIRYAHLKRSSQEFDQFHKALDDIKTADTVEQDRVAFAENLLEKHIFDTEELLFLPIENKCSDVTYSLSQLSATMHAKKRELEKRFGIPKAS